MAWLKRHGWLVAACLVGLALPKLATMIGQEFYISVASRVLIWALLATSLNLLVGTGMHAGTRGWRARAATELEAVYATFPILKDRRHAQAGLLSGGQQQMLVIGRALMTTPRLVAIDEPSLGLAPNITDQVYERLIALRTERKLTLLIVEQSSTRAMMVGGRMMLMRGGEIVLDGDARALGQSEAMQAAYFGYGEH